MSDGWPWLALIVLGSYHGLNPAMGWLFAVARGLQEKRRRAVLEALVPIALGHAASVALVVALVIGAGLVIPVAILRPVGAAALILFGLYRFLRSRAHPRWVGMRVSLPELAVWSFLMSTAHGAGLMLFPVLLGLPVTAAHSDHTVQPGLTTALVTGGMAAVLVHTTAMLAMMAIVAMVVYEKLGLTVLRWAWVNLDLIWAVTIVAAGLLTLFI